MSKALNLGDIFSPFAMLGSSWQLFITTTFGLAFIYSVIFIVSNSVGLIERFKSVVKWW